jgi:hypothetical protein
MAQVSADVVATQIEAVTPLLTGMFDYSQRLFSSFQKIMVSEQSYRASRMPTLLRPGGVSNAANFDGGAMGVGSGPKFDFTAMSPVEHTYNIAWTFKTKFGTDSSKKAVVDTVQLTIAEGIKEMRVRIDKYLNLPNSYGTLGTATAYGTNVYTFATGGVRTKPFRAGDKVQVQQGTTSLGTHFITSIDPLANTVTLATTPSGTPAAGDLLIVNGLVPTDAEATHVWYYPLSYSHNNSTAGSFLGWTRSSYPEVRTPTVAANSSPLTPDLLNTLLANLDNALGEDVTETGDWSWYMHPFLQYNLVQYLTMISEITLPMGGENKQVDSGHSRKKNRRFCDIAIKTDINADETRVDLFDFKNWIRAVTKDVGWLKINGQTVATVPNSTSYDFTEMSVLAVAQNFAIRNPRRGGYISGLVSGL